MGGEREWREGGRVDFLGGVLFAGLLIRKYLIHHSLVSKYRGKKAFFSPLLLCDDVLLALMKRRASERAL